MIKKRLNIRMSGLGGQGAVTAAHVMAMAANKDGKFSISNPFFGAEKRMAPAESYCRIGLERIYDRGELVFPDVIEVFHPQAPALAALSARVKASFDPSHLLNPGRMYKGV